MYPTHYVGDSGYISDTEDTLSFEGKSVEHFRAKKEEDKRQKKQNNQPDTGNEKSPKMQSDEIKPKPAQPADNVAEVNQALHGEL